MYTALHGAERTRMFLTRLDLPTLLGPQITTFSQRFCDAQ
jgi:hypothetical protein